MSSSRVDRDVPPIPTQEGPAVQLQGIQLARSLQLSLQSGLSCRATSPGALPFPRWTKMGVEGRHPNGFVPRGWLGTNLAQSKPAPTSHLSPEVRVGWGQWGGPSCPQVCIVAQLLPLPAPPSHGVDRELPSEHPV